MDTTPENVLLNTEYHFQEIFYNTLETIKSQLAQSRFKLALDCK